MLKILKSSFEPPFAVAASTSGTKFRANVCSNSKVTKVTEEIAEVTDEQNEYNQSVSESESNDEISSVGEESEVDFNDFFAGDFGQGEGEESHNKPSITGFKLE